MPSEINGWDIPPGQHPAVAALWAMWDHNRDIFGGSIDNYATARDFIAGLAARGDLDKGTVSDVLARLDAMKPFAVQTDVMREDEAAEYLRVSARTLKRWCVIEDLPHRVVADKRLYSRRAIDLWAAGREVGGLTR